MSNHSPRKPLKSSQSIPLSTEGPPSKEARADDSHRMLVVDANEANRSALVDHYRAQGWDVRSAATTREAFDHALAQQPEVMVIGLSMPDGNAQHLVRTLRSAVEH